MNNKNQLLDTIGAISRLISLVFCELNTKIGIHNHVLVIQKPNNYQPLMRTINGDTKEDISQLYNVIVRLIKWYLIKPEKEDLNNNENLLAINNSEEILTLTKFLLVALKRLQKSYECGNVILAIQYYINLIQDTLEGKYNNSKLLECVPDNEYDTLLDYHKLKNFWHHDKLKQICHSYVNSFQILDDNNINNTDKQVLIDGYLYTVNSILKIMDNDFQKLIFNSNRG